MHENGDEVALHVSCEGAIYFLDALLVNFS
jgi:hypothetical protein